MTTIDITKPEDKYVIDGWNKLMSFESYLDVLAQRKEYAYIEKSSEINKYPQ